jgi:aspartyl protease family protein
MRLMSISLMILGTGAMSVGPTFVGGRQDAAQPSLMKPAAHFALAADPSVEATKPQNTVMSEIEQAPDGLFYLSVRINEKPMRFVVDSGASVVVLTKADAQALSLDASSNKRQSIQTASGSKPMRWTRLDKLSVAGQTLTNLDAAIIDSGLETSLLGQNALAQLGSVVQTGTLMQIRHP